MPVDLSKLTFAPDEQLVEELAASWKWLLKNPIKPILFSMFGDVFYEDQAGRVFWLNVGTAEKQEIAASTQEFRQRLASSDAELWLLHPIVERLHKAGKIPTTGQCYTYIILPIFEEGSYEVDNFCVVPAREAIGYLGSAHEQLRDLPPGAQVQVKIVP